MKKLFMLFLVLTAANFAQIVGPKISVLQKDFDFGNIKQNVFVEHDFIVSNTGGDSLYIYNVSASCGCTAAKPEKDILKPGESTKINVKFNTIGREGTQHKYVYVNSNDKENPEIRLAFTANVIRESFPKLVISDTQHDFGTIEEGKVVDWTLNFKNDGKATLEIKEVKTDCGCTAAVISGKKIEPGKSGNLRIEFDSAHKSGKITRNVTILSNDTDKPEQTIVIYADVHQK
ncbi:MAG: DUF1573 domain-containing protein [Clostridiales bacterium]